MRRSDVLVRMEIVSTKQLHLQNDLTQEIVVDAYGVQVSIHRAISDDRYVSMIASMRDLPEAMSVAASKTPSSRMDTYP